MFLNRNFHVVEAWCRGCTTFYLKTTVYIMDFISFHELDQVTILLCCYIICVIHYNTFILIFIKWIAIANATNLILLTDTAAVVLHIHLSDGAAVVHQGKNSLHRQKTIYLYKPIAKCISNSNNLDVFWRFQEILKPPLAYLSIKRLCL